jgi:hypothetical protein
MPLGASRLAFLAKAIIEEGVAGIDIGSVNYGGTTDNYSNQSVNTSGADSALRLPSAITIVFVAKPTYNLERLNIMGISDLNNALRNNIFINTSGTIRFYNALVSGTSDRTSTETLTNNDWNMVAISKDVGSGQISGYMNGSSITFPTETVTGTTFDFDGTGTDIGIGTARAGDHDSYMWNGDVAWVGVWPTYRDFTNSETQNAVWDSTNSRAQWPGTSGTGYGFGPPIIFHYGDETTVATNQGNIASYTLTEGGSPTNGADYTATDIGSRIARTVTAVNDAQIDTAQSKFGGSSYLGDGASDYLTIDVADFGTWAGSSNDFTIECFARATNVSNKGIFHIHADPDYNAATGANSVACAFYGGSAQWQVYFKGTSSAALGLTASSNTTNTWYHIAVVRNSGTTYFYVDGVQQWSSTDTYDYSSARYLQLGAYYTSAYSLPGHIDEFRISKTARYTSGFTPTTSAFTNDSDTLLLLHMDGDDASTTFTDDNS